jgi:hypothetical protein
MTIEQINLYNEKRFRREIERRHHRRILKNQKIKNVFKETNKPSTISEQRKLDLQIAPRVFCLFSNTEECIHFFSEIRKKINEGKEIYFDMSEIIMIDVSTIMYLLSIFKNLKHNRIAYHIKGNVPKNAENYHYLQNTGFFSYVTNKTSSIQYDNSTVMIKEGNEVSGKTAKEICDFIMQKENKQKIEIRHQYELLIELMNNTKQHAYINNTIVHNWYVYCHVINNSVEIIFFDNGVGIPATVNKTKGEEFTRWLNKRGLLMGGDLDILDAALDGAFKTKTKEKHRGKGLPMIKTLIERKLIRDLKIITNYAFYSTDTKERKNIKKDLQGTLYHWEV